MMNRFKTTSNSYFWRVFFQIAIGPKLHERIPYLEQRMKSPSSGHQCLVCGKHFATLHYRRVHEAVHQGHYSHVCKICGQGLFSSTDLRGHMANRHQMKKDFKCSHCDAEFGYKKNLMRHLKSCQGDKTNLFWVVFNFLSFAFWETSHAPYLCEMYMCM